MSQVVAGEFGFPMPGPVFEEEHTIERTVRKRASNCSGARPLRRSGNADRI